MEPFKFRVERLHEDVEIPGMATYGSAGRDLKSYLNGRQVMVWDAEVGEAYVVELPPENAKLVLSPNSRALIPTGIKVSVPVGYEVQVRARSGLAVKHGLALINGVGTIDSDFRGEVMVPAINLGFHTVTITHGERIAQAVVSKYEDEPFWEAPLSDTDRGEGGFGSTGL